MKRFKAPCSPRQWMVIVSLCLSHLADSQARAESDDLTTVAKRHVIYPEKGNPFLLSETPFGGPVLMLKVNDDKHILELNNLSYKTQFLEITAADKLNGVSAKGIVSLICDAWRVGIMTSGGSTKDWSEWKEGAPDDPLIRILMINKGGKWQTESQIKLSFGWVPTSLITASHYEDELNRRRAESRDDAQKQRIAHLTLDPKLSELEAWQIDIIGRHVIANDCWNGVFSFSPDEAKIAYVSVQDREGAYIVGRELQPPHHILFRIKSHEPEEANSVIQFLPQPLAITWSPDQKRLAYTTVRGIFHIVDIAKGSDTILPSLEMPHPRRISWVGPDHINVDFGSESGIVDLQTLKLTREKVTLGATSAHRHARWATTQQLADELKAEEKYLPVNGHDDLVLCSRDGKYARQLLPNLFQTERGPQWTPSLRYFAQWFGGDKALVIHELGTRGAVPPRSFRVVLRMPTSISQSEGEMDYFVRAKREKRFYSAFYPPQTNPLNGQIVGPDLSKLLGYVRLTEWRGDEVDAVVCWEIEPYGHYLKPKGPGLIMGAPVASMPGAHSSKFPKETWAELSLSQNDPTARTQKKPTSQNTYPPRQAGLPRKDSEEGRFPQTRNQTLSQQDIKDWDRITLQYAINEMFARHGMYFKNDSVRSEFERFPWYQPNKSLSFEGVEATFTEIEAANLKLLGDARGRLSNSASKQSEQTSRPAKAKSTNGTGSGEGLNFDEIRKLNTK